MHWVDCTPAWLRHRFFLLRWTAHCFVSKPHHWLSLIPSNFNPDFRIERVLFRGDPNYLSHSIIPAKKFREWSIQLEKYHNFLYLHNDKIFVLSGYCFYLQVIRKVALLPTMCPIITILSKGEHAPSGRRELVARPQSARDHHMESHVYTRGYSATTR